MTAPPGIGIPEHTGAPRRTPDPALRTPKDGHGEGTTLTNPTHCHPGQARTVYPRSQSGGYLRCPRAPR
jgi:hypothetical protein